MSWIFFPCAVIHLIEDECWILNFVGVAGLENESRLCIKLAVVINAATW